MSFVVLPGVFGAQSSFLALIPRQMPRFWGLYGHGSPKSSIYPRNAAVCVLVFGPNKPPSFIFMAAFPAICCTFSLSRISNPKSKYATVCALRSEEETGNLEQEL